MVNPPLCNLSALNSLGCKGFPFIMEFPSVNPILKLQKSLPTNPTHKFITKWNIDHLYISWNNKAKLFPFMTRLW